MKYFYLILLLVVGGPTLADTILYSNDEFGINIVKSNEISSLKQSGNYISFTLNSERFFMLTAFTLKHSSSSKYPNAGGINAAFSHSQASKTPNYSILDKSDISIDFNNQKITGSLYVSHYSGSTRMLCDMNFIHPIGNQYYWIMTLTTAAEECKHQRDSLMKSLHKVYRSISVG